jgi:hypothetical protein
MSARAGPALDTVGDEHTTGSRGRPDRGEPTGCGSSAAGQLIPLTSGLTQLRGAFVDHGLAMITDPLTASTTPSNALGSEPANAQPTRLVDRSSSSRSPILVQSAAYSFDQSLARQPNRSKINISEPTVSHPVVLPTEAARQLCSQKASLE